MVDFLLGDGRIKKTDFYFKQAIERAATEEIKSKLLAYQTN